MVERRYLLESMKPSPSVRTVALLIKIFPPVMESRSFNAIITTHHYILF